MEVKDVLTVDDYGAIRRARCDGKSIRRIALHFDHSRNTIRYVLKHPEPGFQTRNRNAPCWGRFRPSSTKSWPTTRSIPQAAAYRIASLSPPP